MSPREAGRLAGLETVLRQLEGRAPWPGAGASAGLVTALAAGLVEETARDSTETWKDAGAAIAQAVALRDRALRLARENAKAYQAARAALAAASDRPQPGDVPLGPALAQAADVPLELAEAAGDVVELAAWVADRADPDVGPDAAAAGLLAAGAARASAHLVDVNLATRPGDQRSARAREVSERARATSEGTLASGTRAGR